MCLEEYKNLKKWQQEFRYELENSFVEYLYIGGNENYH